ncbi:Nitrogen regulation protein NIFR3 [Staphylococcus aureus]|nr:Nitrogen regulation protein NIFR3 [Staphylococcus aureus]
MKMRLQQAFFNSSQGPQHREIGFPISTDNASWGVGPNTENFEKKFYRQCELGCGPQHREIGFPISTDNASWGVGPNKENFEKKFYRQCELGCGPQQREFRKEILQAMRVGVWAPTQKLTISQLTIMCKLGWYNDKVILFL